LVIKLIFFWIRWRICSKGNHPLLSWVALASHDLTALPLSFGLFLWDQRETSVAVIIQFVLQLLPIPSHVVMLVPKVPTHHLQNFPDLETLEIRQQRQIQHFTRVFLVQDQVLLKRFLQEICLLTGLQPGRKWNDVVTIISKLLITWQMIQQTFQIYPQLLIMTKHLKLPKLLPFHQVFWDHLESLVFRQALGWVGRSLPWCHPSFLPTIVGVPRGFLPVLPLQQLRNPPNLLLKRCLFPQVPLSYQALYQLPCWIQYSLLVLPWIFLWIFLLFCLIHWSEWRCQHLSRFPLSHH